MSMTIITLGCFVISLIYNILFWDKMHGISVPIFSIIVISFLLWMKRSVLSKNKLTIYLHIFLLLYLSICVAIFRNDIITKMTIPTIFAGLGALVFINKEGYSFSNSLGVIESLKSNIFSGVKSSLDAISMAYGNIFVNDKESKKFIFKKTLIGIIISTPFLIVFVWLFTSADLVFEMHLKSVFDIIWQPDIFKRGIFIICLWVFFCGYLYSTEKEVSLESKWGKNTPTKNYDGIIVFVFFLMNNLLFLSFIIVQIGYLFGGTEFVKNTPLTYAEYAHKGFYEFWIAVILVLSIITITNSKLKELEGSICHLVEYSQIIMICQTMFIIFSGIKRIIIYEEAYGYTYLRILVALFYMWMLMAFVILVLKIIKKKSLTWFASESIAISFIFLVFMSTFSIDKFIANRNIDRYLKQGKILDMEYLSKLSTDIHDEMKHLEKTAVDENIKTSAKKILYEQSLKTQYNLKYWGSWNLSLYRASVYMEEIIEDNKKAIIMK